MNGSINLSKPNAQAAALVRSLSLPDGSIANKSTNDNCEEQPSSCLNHGLDDSLTSLQDIIADSKPISRSVSNSLTRLKWDSDLTASSSTSIAAGRSILEKRAKRKQHLSEKANNNLIRSLPPSDSDERLLFTASVADTPIIRRPHNTKRLSASLKSCLSSSSNNLNSSSNSNNCCLSSSMNDNNEHQFNNNKKVVSFSRVRVREYEVTCESDLTSSCPIIGLGWSYNPIEIISSLENGSSSNGSAKNNINNSNNNEKKKEKKAATVDELSLSLSAVEDCAITKSIDELKLSAEMTSLKEAITSLDDTNLEQH